MGFKQSEQEIAVRWGRGEHMVEQCVDIPARGNRLCRDAETGKSMVNFCFFVCVCVRACTCLEYTQLGERTPN